MTGTRLPLKTDRLLLRKYQDRDVADIVAYGSGADFWLARNLDWQPTAAGVKAYFEPRREITPESYPEWLNLMIVLKAEDRVVGNVGIGVASKEHRQASIGWLLGCRYRGRGIATEAARAVLAFGFEAMGMHRIYARTSAQNTGSWRLMERLGMRREAHLRQTHQIHGQWADEFYYAMLVDEWRQVQRQQRKAASVPGQDPTNSDVSPHHSGK